MAHSNEFNFQSNLDGGNEDKEPSDGQQQKNAEMEAKVRAVLRKLAKEVTAATIVSQELYKYLGGKNLLNWLAYCEISDEVTGGSVGYTEFYLETPPEIKNDMDYLIETYGTKFNLDANLEETEDLINWFGMCEEVDNWNESVNTGSKETTMGIDRAENSPEITHGGKDYSI